MPRLLKNAVRASLAVLALTAITYLSLLPLARLPEFARLPLTGGRMLLRTLLDRSLVVGAMAYPVVRSRWSGSQLVFAVGAAYFGIYTLVPQFEAGLVFPDAVTSATVALLTAHGFLMAVAFSVLLVCAMGRLGGEEPRRESGRLQMAATQWLWRLSVCLVARLVLKVAGVSLRHRLLGAGLGLAGAPHPWAWLLLQAGQAMLLVVFALPLLKMMKGGRLEASLTLAGVLFAVGAVGPVLSAQPFVPTVASLARMADLGGTNLLYGALVGFLFSRNGHVARSNGRGRPGLA